MVPQRRGYVRNTLKDDRCDVWPGVATQVEMVATTRPYYRSTYVFLTRADRGLKIRSFYRNPQAVLRPLGYHCLKDLGFGATVVTYRNCPNNCPLAWWWDSAAIPGSRCRGRWYPLFPRRV